LVSFASEVGERRFSFHRLVTEMPVMNFLIVEYEDGSSEVLFGWGRYAEALQEAVFRSSYYKLVKQFSKLYEALTLDGVSDQLSLRELANVAHGPDGAGRPPEIVEAKQWNVELVHELLESVQDGEEVRVWITFFVDCARTEHIFRNLVDRGVKVQVLMMNPNNYGLVQSRFRLRKGYRDPGAVRAKNTIHDQLKTFQAIAEETKGQRGSLEVMPCDTMPFGVFYQIANRVMLVGLLLSEEAWEEGPLTKFYPGTQQWDVFMRNWHSCWNLPLETSLHHRDSPLSEIIQSRWSEAQPSFDDQLRTVQPNYDGPEQEDLRIATIAFTGGGAPEDLFLTLAKRGVRIKILLTDPDRTDLLEARNAVRHKYEDGETPQAALDALKQQIARLSRLKETVQGLRARGCRGELDFRLSSLMPHGFVAHSSKWALLGLFLATGSYGLGPMFIIDAEKNAAVWLALKEDWQARWNECEQRSKEGVIGT